MNTGRFGTNVYSLPNLFACSLPKLPWEVVAAPVKLKVLVALEPFVADLADEAVRCH